MTDGESRTGAASHEEEPPTRAVRRAEQLVRRLQARIVKAQRAGRGNRCGCPGAVLQAALSPGLPALGAGGR